MSTSPSARATEPLIEWGIGGLASFIPDYPAAAQNHLNWIPFPVFIYRGTWFNSDFERGLSGKLLKADRVKIDFSFDGAFAVDSKKNDARAGMPNLEWLFEGGPALEIVLNDVTSLNRFKLQIPFRWVISTNFKHVRYRGYLTEPGLAFVRGHFPWERCEFSLSLSSIIANRRLQNYFYEVDSPYVTATRPEFHARDGYMGSTFNAYQKFAIGRNSLYFSYTLQSHHGAVNQGSPLFLRKWTQTFTVALVLIFYSSEAREVKQSGK